MFYWLTKFLRNITKPTKNEGKMFVVNPKNKAEKISNSNFVINI